MCWPCSGAPAGTTCLLVELHRIDRQRELRTVHRRHVRDVAVRDDRRVVVQLTRRLHRTPRARERRQRSRPLGERALGEDVVEDRDQLYPVGEPMRVIGEAVVIELRLADQGASLPAKNLSACSIISVT